MLSTSNVILTQVKPKNTPNHSSTPINPQIQIHVQGKSSPYNNFKKSESGPKGPKFALPKSIIKRHDSLEDISIP